MCPGDPEHRKHTDFLEVGEVLARHAEAEVAPHAVVALQQLAIAERRQGLVLVHQSRVEKAEDNRIKHRLACKEQ